MVYVCDNCGCLFSRAEEQDQCPDCGKHMIRSANREELIANVWAKRSGGSTMRFLMPVRLPAQPGDTSGSRSAACSRR